MKNTMFAALVALATITPAHGDTITPIEPNDRWLEAVSRYDDSEHFFDHEITRCKGRTLERMEMLKHRLSGRKWSDMRDYLTERRDYVIETAFESWLDVWGDDREGFDEFLDEYLDDVKAEFQEYKYVSVLIWEKYPVLPSVATIR